MYYSSLLLRGKKAKPPISDEIVHINENTQTQQASNPKSYHTLLSKKCQRRYIDKTNQWSTQSPSSGVPYRPTYTFTTDLNIP